MTQCIILQSESSFGEKWGGEREDLVEIIGALDSNKPYKSKRKKN